MSAIALSIIGEGIHFARHSFSMRVPFHVVRSQLLGYHLQKLTHSSEWAFPPKQNGRIVFSQKPLEGCLSSVNEKLGRRL